MTRELVLDLFKDRALEVAPWVRCTLVLNHWWHIGTGTERPAIVMDSGLGGGLIRVAQSPSAFYGLFLEYANLERRKRHQKRPNSYTPSEGRLGRVKVDLIHQLVDSLVNPILVIDPQDPNSVDAFDDTIRCTLR